jgi:hypothetical protein
MIMPAGRSTTLHQLRLLVTQVDRDGYPPVCRDAGGPVPPLHRRADRQAANDPARGAQAILKVVAAGNPPLHLALGADALGVMRKKIASL